MADPVAIKPLSGYDEGLYSPDDFKKEYSPTWVEWAAQNLLQIKKLGTDTNTYTVPDGKVLYITSAHMAGVGRIWFLGEDKLIIENEIIRSNAAAVTAAFPMPLKFVSGTIFKWDTAANIYGGFEGFFVSFK